MSLAILVYLKLKEMMLTFYFESFLPVMHLISWVIIDDSWYVGDGQAFLAKKGNEGHWGTSP